MKGKLVAVSVSEQKGTPKVNRPQVFLRKDWGLDGDAHAGDGSRQASLLAIESIRKMQGMGLNVGPGDFAENLTTEGLKLTNLPVGEWLRVGKEAVLEVTQIGKECHSRCAIYEQAGDCVMPKEGIFARVLKDGSASPGDPISVCYRAGVLTVSDRSSRGEREDVTGPALCRVLEDSGFRVVSCGVVPDEREPIKQGLLRMVGERIPLILTNGGTGLSPRDVTPEATSEVIAKPVPGIGEAMRRGAKTPRAMLSRALAGIADRSLIINLPGSPKGAVESFSNVLPVLEHALEVLQGDTLDCGH